jgi:hypothetical protein
LKINLIGQHFSAQKMDGVGRDSRKESDDKSRIHLKDARCVVCDTVQKWVMLFSVNDVKMPIQLAICKTCTWNCFSGMKFNEANETVILSLNGKDIYHENVISRVDEDQDPKQQYPCVYSQLETNEFNTPSCTPVKSIVYEDKNERRNNNDGNDDGDDLNAVDLSEFESISVGRGIIEKVARTNEIIGKSGVRQRLQFESDSMEDSISKKIKIEKDDDNNCSNPKSTTGVGSDSAKKTMLNSVGLQSYNILENFPIDIKNEDPYPIHFRFCYECYTDMDPDSPSQICRDCRRNYKVFH